MEVREIKSFGFKLLAVWLFMLHAKRGNLQTDQTATYSSGQVNLVDSELIW